MRLHHLRVQALQAFAGATEVDFDALSEAGLFLLHGDTGAGKTTLLDAVCLALFGRLPGARGSQARPRSDHAAADVPTEVTLELTLRGERVRITRAPEQERPKIRGEGTTVAKARVLLEAVGADGATRVLATGHDEAAAELDRLLGMSREQFCQVVLLPQGRFATFLHARSDEREELLARLFGTERFEQAERWLTERRRQAETALRAATTELTDSASKLSHVLGAEPPEGWEADPGRLGEWVAGAQVLADADLATAQGVVTVAREERARAQAALAAAQAQGQLRARHAQSMQELERFGAGAAARRQAAGELERARAAAGLAPLLEAAAGDAVAAAGAAAATALAVGALPTTGCAPDAARARAGALRTEAGEAGALAPAEAAIAERDARLREAQAEREHLLGEVQAAERWLQGADARGRELARTADAARLAVAQADEHAAAAQAAAERAGAARVRDDLAGELAHIRLLHDRAVSEEQDARERWLQMRQDRLDGMAGELAGGLVDGQPCVVCGALEHPEPAAHLAGRQVDATAERAAQARADERRRVRDTHRQELAETADEHAAALATAGREPLEALTAAAEHAHLRAGATVRAAEAAPAAQAALAEHGGQQDRTMRALQLAAGRLAAVNARIDGWQSAQAEDRARLQAALGDSPTVADRVAGLEALAGAHEAAAAAIERGREAAAAARRSAHRAAEAARSAGFPEAGSARAALLDAGAMAAREELVRRFDEGLAERRHRAADPELVAAAAGAPPDEASARTAAREATEADALAEQQQERARARSEALRTLRRELERRSLAHGPLAAEAARVRHLATLVDGTSPQNHKRMRLRAYVLAARLEEIAAAASVRLQGMTDGRYTLAHDDERASRGVRSGLGLRVTDGWTGQDRHPSSLSGGETFLASLALALGLADVVAAEAGGARLETLFVDEGFGSLDERALDEVLDVLDGLRDGGRAVGVVSHVAELRQRIPAQVHVVKGRQGSRVVQTAPAAGALGGGA